MSLWSYRYCTLIQKIASTCIKFIQGIASGFFHLCPSNRNLQLDTLMMKLFLVLLFIICYKLRHPVSHFSTLQAMFLVILVLVLEVTQHNIP